MVDNLEAVKTAIALKRQSDRASQASAIKLLRNIATDTVKIGDRQRKSGFYTYTLNDGSTLVNGQKISNADVKPGSTVTTKQNGELISIDSKVALGKSRIRLITPTSEASNKGAKYTSNQLKNQGYLNRQIYTFPKEDDEVDSIIYLYTIEESLGIISYYVGGLSTGSKLIKTFNTSQYTIIWAYVDNLGSRKYSVDFIYDFNDGINPIDRIVEHWTIDLANRWTKSFLTSSSITGDNYRPTVVSKGYGFFRTVPFQVESFASGVDGSYTANSRVIYAFKDTLKTVDYFSTRVIDGETLYNTFTDFTIYLPVNDQIDGYDFKVLFDDSSFFPGTVGDPESSRYTRDLIQHTIYRTDKKFTKAIGDYLNTVTRNIGTSSSTVTTDKFTSYDKLGNIATTNIDYASDSIIFGDFDLFGNKFTSIRRDVDYITNATTEKPTIPVRLFNYGFKQTSVKKRKTNLPTVKNSTLEVINYSYSNK